MCLQVNFTVANHMTERDAWYYAEHIVDTNIFLVIKQRRLMYSFVSYCVCDVNTVTPRCTLDQYTHRLAAEFPCECPCFTTPDFNPCRNEYQE